MEIRRRVKENKGWEFEVTGFPFLPVRQGQRLRYGNYEFEVVPLKGHTYGQMGLYEARQHILFSADQVIDGIVPIVGTTFPDEHLLAGYLASLNQFLHVYKSCMLLPAHNEPIWDVKRVVNRILYAYNEKIELMRQILYHSRREMTVRQVGCIAYGMGEIPADTKEFVKLKMVMSKTFSCLEYLRDRDLVIRSERDGTFYWQSAEL